MDTQALSDFVKGVWPGYIFELRFSSAKDDWEARFAVPGLPSPQSYFATRGNGHYTHASEILDG
jgi:hypothetical protein